jgi:hypothetical protein
MTTVLAIGSRNLHWCQTDSGRIVAIRSWEIPEGADPIDAIAACDLPSPLGRVRVVLHHPDILIHGMSQPPTTPDRMQRLVGFELDAQYGDKLAEVFAAWHTAQTVGENGVPVLIMLTRRDLVRRLESALAIHKGRVTSIMHPANALVAPMIDQDPPEPRLLALDCSAGALHAAMVENHELIFLRSSTPGMDPLVNGIADLRSIPAAEARTILGKLGAEPPADIAELIERQAATLATQINAGCRLLQTQIGIRGWEPDAIYLSGAGARLPDLAPVLSQRLRKPVRLINPFLTGVALTGSEQDAICELPSPWTAPFGAALKDEVELEGLSQPKRERAAFWRTRGCLRVAAAVAAALLVALTFHQQLTIDHLQQRRAVLAGAGDGLVPQAREHLAIIASTDAEIAALREQILYLDGERRAGRLASEFLHVVASIQDAGNCPIALEAFSVERPSADLTVLSFSGAAASIGTRTTGEVLNTFESQLVARHPLFEASRLHPKKLSIDAVGAALPFAYSLHVPDARR